MIRSAIQILCAALLILAASTAGAENVTVQGDMGSTIRYVLGKR